MESDALIKIFDLRDAELRDKEAKKEGNEAAKAVERNNKAYSAFAKMGLKLFPEWPNAALGHLLSFYMDGKGHSKFTKKPERLAKIYELLSSNIALKAPTAPTYVPIMPTDVAV